MSKPEALFITLRLALVDAMLALKYRNTYFCD